jgi:DNA-directed RNA polymerase subunit RPC12/RpoP
MDRRELDAIAAQLIAAAGDADAIAATVPPSQVGRTIRRLHRASYTLGGAMHALERLHGLSDRRTLHSTVCEVCLVAFAAERSDARYCSTRCRVAAHRRRVTAVTATTAEPVPVVVDHAEAAAESSDDGDVPEGAPRRDRWTEVRTARKADHEAGKHVEFAEGCPPCEDDHGRHAGLEEFVVGCAGCEAAEEALNAALEAEYAARLKADRKAEREAARLRAAWLAANPEAIAWRCAGCDAEFTDADADQGQGALYECGECGSPFSRGNSADGDSNRCPECNHFGSKLAEFACPECNEGELEPVGEETPVPA